MKTTDELIKEFVNQTDSWNKDEVIESYYLSADGVSLVIKFGNGTYCDYTLEAFSLLDYLTFLFNKNQQT